MTLSLRAKRNIALNQAELLHKRYCDYNQAERVTSRKLADNGHPAASLYNAIQREFDTLRFACNSNARLIGLLVDDAGNQVASLELWCPTLGLPWDCFKEIDGEYFGHIYPAHDKYERYVDANIAAKFPGVNKSLDGGQFLLRVNLAHTLQDFPSYTEIQKTLSEKDIAYGTRENETGYGYITVSFNNIKSVKQFKLTLRELTAPFKGARCLLPKCRAGEATDFTKQLPLQERQIYLAKVKSPIDTGRVIKLPLIPLGEEGIKIQAEINTFLEEKIKQGYPAHLTAPYVK